METPLLKNTISLPLDGPSGAYALSITPKPWYDVEPYRNACREREKEYNLCGMRAVITKGQDSQHVRLELPIGLIVRFDQISFLVCEASLEMYNDVGPSNIFDFGQEYIRLDLGST